MNNYCENPWTQSVIKLFDDRIKFCCKVTSVPPDKYYTHLNEVKTAFLNNEKHPACNVCWKDEAQGGKSFRLLNTSPVNKEELIKLQTNENNLKILDVEFGYVCNMFCMSCGPHQSSTWQQKLKVTPWKTKFFDEKVLENLTITLQKNRNTLQKINVFGGEPSVDPAFYKFVDILKKETLSNCNIKLITNGNYSETYKEKFENSIQALIESGKTFEITFSLDGAGVEGEFIRGGLDNAKFIKNIKDMLTFGIVPQVQISISILNLENFIEIFKWFESEVILDKVRFHLNKISHPWEFSINSLGKHIIEFLPIWPIPLDDPWQKLYTQFTNFIGTQNNNAAPNKESLKKFIYRLDMYSVISKKELPAYYILLKTRLNKILASTS
jgi:pyruvate-formate lyase-activating enzyme